jgi:hypothetical protein
VDRRSSDVFQWPFVGETDEADDKIDGLQDGVWLHGSIEVLGDPVEEELGPEEAFQCGSDLI